MKNARILLAILVFTVLASAGTGAFGQMPNNEQLKFEAISGPNDNPVIWRVLMNEYTYSHFRRKGLVHERIGGTERPGMFRALNGKYYPLQYIGRRGAYHELRLVQVLADPGKVSSPPSRPGSSYQNRGGYACSGGADYPSAWRREASCFGYGCNFGKLELKSCLALGARKGTKLVIHGNPGGSRANECWLQNSCVDLHPSGEFTLFRP